MCGGNARASDVDWYTCAVCSVASLGGYGARVLPDTAAVMGSRTCFVDRPAPSHCDSSPL